MKQWIISGFTLFLLVVFTSNASASTVPINCSPGFILQFSGQSATGNDLRVSLGANPSERLSLGLGYASPSGYYTFSVRYSFVKNLAIAASYSSSNPVAWNLDLRVKHNFDESLALVGLIGYDGANVNGISQAEYWITEQFAGNIGLGYYHSSSLFILGCEFLLDRIDMGLDCRFPGSNPGQTQVVVFVAYQLK